jgi:hypothetical protein
LDIKAREISTNSVVVIENQIYKTDHDHLGKLITYAAFFKAQIIIWISQEVREDHRAAIDWLNNNTGENLNFYAVETNIIKIGDSKHALNFKLKAFPNGAQKSANASNSEISEKGEAYRAFFQKLIDELRDKYRFTNARIGQPQSWYSFTTGIKGIQYSCSFAIGSKVRAELYIDTPNKELNKAILSVLKENEAKYQPKFDSKIEWEDLPTRRAARMAVYREGDISADTEAIEEIKNWCIKQLLAFKEFVIPETEAHIQTSKSKLNENLQIEI